MESEVQVKFEGMEAECKRVNHRLEALERTQASISEMVADIRVMATEMTHMREAQTAIQSELTRTSARIDDIERKPLKLLDESKASAVKTIVSALAGALLIGIIWLLTEHGGM